jgi:hypothetical protein
MVKLRGQKTKRLFTNSAFPFGFTNNLIYVNRPYETAAFKRITLSFAQCAKTFDIRFSLMSFLNS